jgi:hypothetical protein
MIVLKFVNREKEIDELTTHVENNYKAQLGCRKAKFQSETMSSNISLIFANQTYGAGKTRFGEEYLTQVAAKKVKTDFENEVCQSIRIYIRLKHRLMLPEVPKDTLEEELMNLILYVHPSPLVTTEVFSKYLETNPDAFSEFGGWNPLFKLGMYIRTVVHPDKHLYIMIDKIDKLLTYRFKGNSDYDVIEGAKMIWTCLLTLGQIPGIHIFSTTRSMLFHCMGRGMIPKCRSSPFKEIIMNPINKIHLQDIIDSSSELEFLSKKQETDPEDFDDFLEKLLFKSQGNVDIIQGV